MKIRKTVFACTPAVLLAGLLGTFAAEAFADEPDPLALPCTIGAVATKKNPISGHMDKFLCEQCGSETCWIYQSDK